MTDLAERVVRLEREVAAIKIIFQTATGFDPYMAEDSKSLRDLIQENPGLSQTEVCRAARARFSLSRQRTVEVLRLGVAKHWRIEAGLQNALLYYPIASGTQSHSEFFEQQEAGNKTSEHDLAEFPKWENH